MTIPEDWKSEEEYGYSPSRYDPDGGPSDPCLKCGGEIKSAGGRSGIISYCPSCEVTVFLL